MLKIGIFTFSFLLLIAHLTMAGKQELQTVVQGNGLFAKQLYKVLAKEPEKNVFFSPISVHAVLSMAHQGAKRQTYDDISTALHVPNSSVSAEGYKDVLDHLNNIANVTLSMANKIYIMKDHTMKPAFQEVNEKKFLSSVEAVNFADSEVAAGKINGWVEEKTNNKIKDLIQPADLDIYTRLVLVNAIYFKGNWATKFESTDTRTGKFYLNDNNSVDVQMMNIYKATFPYKQDFNLNAKVLELPYSNKDVSLIVILPNKRNGIVELENQLLNSDITKITENMYESEVIVKLPKFKIETTIDLKEPLSELGLGIIFDERKADFSDMLESPERLFVSKAIQKAFIEVNEEGTEAAAATAVIFGTAGGFGSYDPIKQFYADHPFVVLLMKKQHLLDAQQTNFFINNSIINHVLFFGRIVDPSA